MASFDITRRNGDKYTVLVDDDDLELLQPLGRWCVFTPKKGGTYVYTNFGRGVGRKTKQFLHRMLLGWPDSSNQVDHINGNGLDNRRCNLRICSPSENSRNRRQRSDNTSGYKGVSWDKWHEKYKASLTANGKAVRIGYFKTAEEAHEAYCAAAKIHHGDFFNPG